MRSSKILLLATIVAATVMGLAATDLILPAVPALAQSLEGTPTQAQWVLASFAAGSALGLLAFGEICSRSHPKIAVAASLVVFGLASLLATQLQSLNGLIAIRFIQGFSAAAPVVVAPGLIRTILPEHQALRALGVMGSIESLTPALAPIFGAWLLTWSDWSASFYCVAVCALILTILWVSTTHTWPWRSSATHNPASYWQLLRNRLYLTLALSYGLSLASLLVFVLSAPQVMVLSLGGSINDFIIMQILGITFFIGMASTSEWWVAKFGSRAMALFGSGCMAAGFAAMLALALVSSSLSQKPPMVGIWLIFIVINAGMGWRGPPGFLAALQAADGSDNRASALLVIFFVSLVAGGTALVGVVIERGLVPLAAVALLMALGAVCLLIKPSLVARGD